ncbi:MAG TPA: PEGA domain-containing protein [Ignavibacteriaceae bacterium]|jgi:hypothetical protein
MKKLLFLALIFVTTLIIISCESSEDPVTPDPPGSLGITSNPSGAQIWIDGVNTSQTTPDTVTGLEEGVYSVTLKLSEYEDTTFSISITSGETSVVGPITLVSDVNTTFYGGSPIRIYESFGTTASEPSGIDLSSGMAYGISGANANLVDIYFYSDATGNTYLVQSADNHSGLNRRTDFFVGSSTDIYDGVDSPLRAIGTWTDGMDEAENNYTFLYDHDGHYSKLRIVNRGGGTGFGDPAWIDVQWYYNNDYLDERFK